MKARISHPAAFLKPARFFPVVSALLGLIATLWAVPGVAQSPQPTAATGQTPAHADPVLPVWGTRSPGEISTPNALLPDVVGELDALQIANPFQDLEASPAVQPTASSALGFSGPSGAPTNIYWMTPPAWDAGDSSIRVPEQVLDQWQGVLEEPLVQEPPKLAAPDSGPPDEAKGFPVQPFFQQPLGNLGAPPAFNANRSFRIGSTRVRYGAALATGASYSNNVFGTPDNTQGDFIFTLTPALFLQAGTKSTARILYAPSLLKYARFKQFDSVNQTFLFDSRIRMSKVEVGLDAGYLTQSGLFLGSEGQTKQRTLQARLFGKYALTRKIDLEAQAAWSSVRSEPGGEVTGISFEVSSEYRYSPKTVVGAALVVGNYTLPQGTTRYQDFLLRLRYSPTSKLIFNGQGGIQFRQSQDDNGVGFSTYSAVLNAKLEWLATRKTLLAMRLFRTTSVDAFTPNSLQTLTGVEFEWTWQITKKTKVELELATGTSENQKLTGAEGDSYFFNQGTLTLEYLPRDGVNLRLFTSLQQRLGASNPDSDFLSNTSGMELGLGF